MSILQKLKSRLDVDIGRIEVSCALVRVERVSGLVVARLVQSTQVIPNFGNVGIQANCPGVRVKSVTVLVDLVIQHTYAAPEGRVPSVTVDSLLIGLVRFRVLLL